MFTYSLKPELCFILIALVATNVFLLYEDVRVVSAEGRPVLAELPHGDEVGCAGGEAPGGAEQGVAVMLPPVIRGLSCWRDEHGSPAQCKEYLSLEGLVLEPDRVLDDGGVGGEYEGQPLGHPGGGGRQGEIWAFGEAGPKWGEDRGLAEYCAASK